MRPFSQDIVDFIERKFQPAEVPKVLAVLEQNADVLSTPRVQRSVLFLSDGSLTMLKHYAATAALDVREILTRAEYVIGVAPLPMPIRSMSRPFAVAGEADDAGRPESAGTVTAPDGADGPAPKRAERPEAGLHGYLVGERFRLGNAEYSVTAEQRHPACVRCLRRADNVVSIVHLPLVFVMEQLSEHIELQAQDTAHL